MRPALREIYFGQWEGLTWQEIEQQDQEYAQRWLAEYPDVPAPGGELFHDFEARIMSEVEALAMLATGRSIVVVTHAGVLRTVLRRLCRYTEAEALEQTQEYCSIVRCTVSASPVAQTIEVQA